MTDRTIIAMNPNTYKWARGEPSVRFMASNQHIHLRTWIPEGQIGRLTEDEWKALLDKYEPSE
jgi:hypothetical protein